MNEAILKTADLRKEFGGVVAVMDVSFEVEKKEEILAIIGPNGAGKTTLFNLISGVHSLTGGEIYFKGQRLNGLEPHVISSLGIARTFQNVQLFGNMTVLENILVGQHTHLKAGLIEAMLRWLPHGPQSGRQRRMELAAFAPVLVPFASLAVLGAVWLLKILIISLIELLFPSAVVNQLAYIFDLIIRIGSLLGRGLSGLAILVGCVLSVWGILLLIRWSFKPFSWVRLAISLGLFLLLSVSFPPLLYVVSLRLLARAEGRAMTALEEEREAVREAVELLNFVGLAERADLNAMSLPFGQQRMLEIARAMATEPEIVLLDEPGAGLNTPEKEELARLVEQIRQGGITVLLVEHDMEFVMGIADRIIVLDYGEKIAEGTPAEVQNNPRVIAAYLGEEDVGFLRL